MSRSFDVNKESLEIYEEYLPFVIAMGREKKWTKKFKNVFENIEYRSNLYNGGEAINYNSIGSFQSSFLATVSTASVVPRSSGSSGGSSFSGGGFSGGGGGSSGGGGW